MFVKFKIKLPPMTGATLKFSRWLMSNMWVLMFLTIAPIIGLIVFMRTEQGQFYRDKYMIKVPVWDSYFIKLRLKFFAVFFIHYTAGQVKISKSFACPLKHSGNKYMEHQIKTIAIPLMLERGRGLTEAFEATGVFTKTAISRFSSGAETGTVKTTALQLADYYEKETTYRLKNAVEAISLFVNMVIMVVLTALTLVLSETATVKPESPHMILPLHFWMP